MLSLSKHLAWRSNQWRLNLLRHARCFDKLSTTHAFSLPDYYSVSF